jgi:hypothetical protein
MPAGFQVLIVVQLAVEPAYLLAHDECGGEVSG